VNIETALEANPMFAETCKPGMRALDDPAMSSEPLAAFHAATGDTSLDAALLQITPAASEVIALLSACSLPGRLRGRPISLRFGLSADGRHSGSGFRDCSAGSTST